MAYPSITPLSTPPNRSMAAALFESTADTFLSELPTFGTQQNALGSWMEGTAGAVETNALTASNSAAAALAAANYKGTWASLTGALNIPASVSHNSKVWLLLNNLADVTTSEPGVSADWAVLTSTGVTRFSILSSATSLTVATRDFVTITASGQTVTLPLTPPLGAEVGISWGNWLDTIVDGNGENIRDANGTLQTTMTLDVANRAIVLIYTTIGWVFV